MCSGAVLLHLNLALLTRDAGHSLPAPQDEHLVILLPLLHNGLGAANHSQDDHEKSIPRWA